MPAAADPRASLGAPRSGGLFTPIFLGVLGATVVASLVWALGHEQLAQAAGQLASGLLIASAALLAVALALPVASSTVRAIARHTLLACLRTKVAAVFIVLLAAALTMLPMIMHGDGTLAGEVQTFLSYATGATAVLLSLVTVFLAAGVIANDVRTRQVYSLATKPVARWQYVLGRWLGLAVLDLMLLSASAVVIYGLARYLEGGKPLSPDDRRKLKTEVLTARVRVPPVPIDIEARVEQRLVELKSDPRGFQDTFAAFLAKSDGDEKKAIQKLRGQIRQDVLEGLQSREAPEPNRPSRPLRWEFRGIDVAGRETRGHATVQRAWAKSRVFRFQTDESLASRVIYRGPVKVDGIEGSVLAVMVDGFDAGFSVEAMDQPALRRLKVGAEARITLDPVIQITYKASPAGDVPDNQLHGLWVVTNPTTGATYYERSATPAGTTATITPPARVVDPDGRTVAEYYNLVDPSSQTGTKVTILQDDIAVLYRVDSFEWNFLRGMVLIQFQLMFLAAVAVFAASFASFPVACLVTLVLLPFSMAREFLADAVKLPTASRTWEAAWYEWVGHYVFKFMVLLLPDFAQTSPGDRLVDGMAISWPDVGAAALLTLAFRTALVLAPACLIFYKRELARVQV